MPVLGLNLFTIASLNRKPYLMNLLSFNESAVIAMAELTSSK